MNHKITEENMGQRLDIFLSGKDKSLSRSGWQKRIKAGEVLVNEEKKHERTTVVSTNTK